MRLLYHSLEVAGHESGICCSKVSTFLYRAMKSSVYGLCHVFESRWAYLQLYPKEHQLCSAEDCG